MYRISKFSFCLILVSASAPKIRFYVTHVETHTVNMLYYVRVCHIYTPRRHFPVNKKANSHLSVWENRFIIEIDDIYTVGSWF